MHEESCMMGKGIPNKEDKSKKQVNHDLVVKEIWSKKGVQAIQREEPNVEKLVNDLVHEQPSYITIFLNSFSPFLLFYIYR